MAPSAFGYFIARIEGAEVNTIPEQSAGSSSDEQPFIGIGDPLLDGRGNRHRGSMVGSTGALAIDAIRSLARLPGTRRELIEEAKTPGANTQNSLFVEEERPTKP